MKKPHRTFNQRLKAAPRCFECSHDGLWLNDAPGKRCYCARGLMLRLADSRNAEKRAGEQEIGFNGGKAA